VSETISLAHGGGGRLARRLIEDVILKELRAGDSDGAASPELILLSDGAVLQSFTGIPVMTTDGFVVTPQVFPGGDIGTLCVTGTVNDLVASGARPRVLSVGLILEDGLPIDDLRRFLKSIRATCEKAHVRVACGDTKVVEHGAADKIFITTAGLGELAVEPAPGPWRLEGRTGVAVILSGTIGDHGVALLGCREGLHFETAVESDCAPLADLILPVLEKFGSAVLCMRDPTRGGLSAVLGEIAEQAGIGIDIVQANVPVKPAVRGVCDLLGLDVFALANEGKMVLFVEESVASAVVSLLQKHPLGRDAAIIGRTVERSGRPVHLVTSLGVRRPLEVPLGETLPRIC